MTKKRVKFIRLALLISLIAIILSYVFWEVWIVHLDGPGFRTKILSSNEPEKGHPKIAKLLFLNTGHIRGDVKLYDAHTDVGGIFSTPGSFQMLSETFLNTIGKINDLNTDYVFITGDLIALEYPLNEKRMPVENEKELFELCWDQIFSHLKRINSKVVVIPGNHDIYNRIGSEVFKNRHGNFYRTFAHKDVRFVILNSSKIESTVMDYYVGLEKKWAEADRLSNDQVDFLKEGFSRNWKEEHIFLFIHHDPRSIPFWEEEIHPLFRNTKCKAVFSGTKWGRLTYYERDGVSYVDSGFDFKEMTPSYFLTTTVYENNDIEFSVIPIMPKKLTAKIAMAFNSFKRYMRNIF